MRVILGQAFKCKMNYGQWTWTRSSAMLHACTVVLNTPSSIISTDFACPPSPENVDLTIVVKDACAFFHFQTIPLYTLLFL